MKRGALLLLLLTACPAGLEEQSHVSKLRVLGVRADPAELILQPDAGLPATTLTALAVTPDGEAQSVQFALCTQLTSAPDPSLPCPGQAGIALPQAGPLAARLDLSDPRILGFAASVQLDAGVFDAGGIAAALDQGVPLLVGLTAAVGLQRLDGFETLTLRSPARGPANTNPEIVDLQIGEDGGVSAGETVRLKPTATKDDATKKYLFSFFATAGSISSLHSTDTGDVANTWVNWTAPDTADAGVRLWVVVRDGRGGTGWLAREVQVR
jgi:hypothetical protein